MGDFYDADLQGTNLQGIAARTPCFDLANLEGTNLEEAHLWGATLTNANLAEANLQGANLQGANLQGAKLEGVKLEGADLREAVGLTDSQLLHASGDALTQLPDGIARPEHWPIAGNNPAVT